MKQVIYFGAEWCGPCKSIKPQLQAANLSLDGFDYESYNTSSDGNEFIYNWTATQIGVTLIG